MVARGTARAISELSPYVAGKTGTTEDSVDGWFIGFTNDVTIAVWVGYDNGDRKRRSLGSAETGAKVALPIFEPVVNAVWSENIAPKAPLSGPSSLAQSQLVDHAIDFESGDRMKRGRGFIKHFRVGPNGQVDDTQYAVLHLSASAARREHVSPEQSSSKSTAPVHNTKNEHPAIPNRNWGVAQGDTNWNWSWGWQRPTSFGPFLRW